VLSKRKFNTLTVGHDWSLKLVVGHGVVVVFKVGHWWSLTLFNLSPLSMTNMPFVIYYTYHHIVEHAILAMNILDEHYLDDDHVLIFDNAKTHSACLPDASSAFKMPVKPKDLNKPDFMVDAKQCDGSIVKR
jgi:hypothetical protein